MRKSIFQKQSNTGAIVGAGLAGLAAGAALVYYLYETESGIERRERIKEGALKAKDKIMDATDKVVMASGAVGSMAKDMYSDMSSLLKERYADLKELSKDDMDVLKNRMREHWAEMKEEIEEAAEKAREIAD